MPNGVNGKATLILVLTIVGLLAAFVRHNAVGVNQANQRADRACAEVAVVEEREQNHYAEVMRELAEIKALIVEGM